VRKEVHHTRQVQRRAVPGPSALYWARGSAHGEEAAPMMTSPREYRRVVLDLLPEQGGWDEEAYLWLTDHTNRLIEFTDGHIEVLPPPTDEHQGILAFLIDAVKRHIQLKTGHNSMRHGKES